MRHETRRRSIGAASLLLWATLSLISLPARAEEPADLAHLQLKADEGVLVLSVDTDLPLKSLRIKRPDQAFADLVGEGAPVGRSVRFLVVRAGHYQWTQIDLGTAAFQRRYVTLDHSNKKRNYEFTVEPGKVNYPGDFLVRAGVSSGLYKQISAMRNGFIVANIGYYVSLGDRFAMLLDELTPEQRMDISKLQLVYIGPGADDFPGHYSRAATAQRTKP